MPAPAAEGVVVVPGGGLSLPRQTPLILVPTEQPPAPTVGTPSILKSAPTLAIPGAPPTVAPAEQPPLVPGAPTIQSSPPAIVVNPPPSEPATAKTAEPQMQQPAESAAQVESEAAAEAPAEQLQQQEVLQQQEQQEDRQDAEMGAYHTQKALSDMQSAKERAQSRLGIQTMQQIDAAALAAGAPPPAFGAEVMAMIKRLGKIVGEQGAKLAALKPAVEVSIDEAAIKKKILDEEERRRKEEEELRRKIQEEQDRLKEERERAERERQRVQDELDRRNKDKRYRDRREREERQAQRERDIRERQDKLKERAENLDQQQKDLDKEDQNFREIEDEFKKDDPNCRSSACQNIRRLRAELQAERTQLAKDQTGLQKDAQQFNKDVEKWQADARELEDLKNQGYGMNDAERKARAADQRVQQIQAQLDEIARQQQDLRRQANWMQAEGGIGDSDAQRLRNQMQGLNGAADSLNESLGNARADAVQANAEALGMGDAYQDALNAYQQDYPGERPTYTHNLRGGLGDRMAEEQRLRGASTESLTESAGRWQQASDAYGQAINDLETIKGQVGQPGVVPTSGNALAQADELANRLGEIQDQLKNTAYGQKFMGQSDFRAAVKAGTGAAQKMAGAESTLRDLGDTDYLGPNVSNRSQDDPLEFRSPAELERAHSFSFTGPAALRGDVMTARGVLESATQDFLGALDQQAAIQNNSPAWQQAQQLQREAAGIQDQLRGLAPAATVDLIGQQVGLFNASLQNGLPLGADGHIDQKAVVNGVGQIANAQARLVQTGAQLEQLGAGAAAQRQAVQAEQERVVGELAQLGVGGKLVDGKFAPAPLTEGAAMMWNMARDQTLKTFEQIERNRQQVAGADGGGTVSTELTPPNRAGPGRLTGQLANQDRALDGMAPSVAAAQAQAGAPPVDPAVRVAQLESARGALESNIGALDRQIAALPVTSAPALALASVRHALDGAKRGVESALADEADKTRAAEHVGQLRTARAGLEQQIAVLDGALADMDYWTPPAVALTATRDSLDAAYRSIDTALQEQAPRAPLATLLMNSAPIQPTEAPAPAPQVAAVQPMEAPAPTIDIGKARPELQRSYAELDEYVQGLDAQLEQVDPNSAEAGRIRGQRDAYTLQRQDVLAIIAGETGQQVRQQQAALPSETETAPPAAPPVAKVELRADQIDIGKARPELQRSYAELDEYVQGLDAQLEQVDPNSAEAGRIRGQRDAYTLQRQDVLATIAAETNQAPRRATPPPAPAAPPRETREATLEGVLQGIETAVAGLDGQLEALPQSAPQRPALLAWRQGLLSGYDNIVEEIQRRRQEDTKPRAQLVMQRQEVPPLDSYMNWVEQGVLPAFGESPLARQVLPGILAGLAFRFGAETADQIVDGALDELEAEGLGPDAAALLDKLFGTIAAATRAAEGTEAGRLADLAHVRFLAEAIRQPELGRAPGSAAKPTPADEAATASLQASLDGLVNRLFEEVGSALRRDVRDLPKTLDHLSGLLELAALPLKERPQLEPLFNEIRRHLDRALAAPPDEAVAVENSARQQITALRRALAALPAGQSPEKAGALAERLAGLLADSYKLLGRALERRAETAGDPAEAASLRRQGAAVRFAEARARLQTGQIVEAWKMLNEARGGDADVENARAAAIIDAVALLEGGYGLLSIDEQRALGTLESLRGARDAALRRLAETASDPAIAAAAAQRLAQQLEGAGRADEAARVIGQALSRSPDDPVLNGERLRLQLAAAGENAAREAANLLGQVPEQARLEAALLALGGLGAKGQGPALEALAAALAGADWVAPENRPAVELQVQLARVDLLSGQTPGAERDAALGQAAARAKALLDGLPASTTEAQARYREAVATSLAELQQQLDGVEGWREAIASGNPPEGGFAVVARQAMAAGHIEIATEALVKLMQAQDGAARGDLVAAVRATTLLLERMRARLEDPNLNEQQRASGQRFLERVSSAALETIGQRLEGWPQSHGTLWQMTYAARQKQSSETADRMERTVDDTQRDFRILVRLQTQIRLAAASPNERGGILNGAVNDLNRQITEQERRIRDEFNPLGKAVESGQTRERLQAALGRLNALRVLRDGVRDYQLDTTGRTEQFVGIDSVFRTAREWALRDVEMGLNGFSRGTATNDSAARTGNARARYIYYTDTIRFFEMLQEKDPKQWTEGLLAADEMAYLERRRVEVIFEDRELTPQQQETRLREHLGHEAATFERWGKDVHPFLLPELSGIGQGDLDRARQIYTRIDANRQSFLEAELDRAKQSGDAQAGFRALVELRERSLKGEIDAFVNYLNLEWYKAGPARAYNLWIGMEGTQEALEWTTAEAGRLHSALIRASYNLPGALSEDDQVLLRRHGYVEGDGAGRYTIPDHARLVPTTVGSEFTAVTQRGPLATVDKLLNAQHLAELTATVALPGGIAGRFGRAVTAELLATGLVRSMGGKVLAYGIGTAAEAAAFTGLSRLGQVAVNPEMLTQGELWRPETLLREFAHNLVVIGALKLKGGATQVLQRASRGIERSLLRNTAQKVLAGSDIPAEAALLTALNAALESNSITQESFLENLGVIVLLRGLHPLTAGGESRWMRQAQARIDRHLRETGREVAPPERGRVGQTGEAWARFYEWVDAYYSPVQQLMVRFEGDWNAARKAYQNGEVTESQMRRMVQLRRQVVDALSDEIVKELGGEVQAFGSENLTSDYDISFVGPRAQVAVILFNARFNKRWAAAVDIGGRETGTVLDTNAYTGPEHANFLGGSRDVWFQDAFAHLAARKYLNDADWAGYRQRLLESAGADRRAGLSEMLDWVEARQREFKDATDRMRAEIAESGEVPAGDVEFAAQNRLYEQNLREIIELKDRYDRASGAERDALAQEIRNAQSKALYFAQEAYQTQAAIDHVVMTIQAAKRAITVESLMSDTPPELSIPLTPDQARQSYLEQIANMMKELSHEGDPAKLASKAAKYLVRGLDAVRIAEFNLGDFRAVVESTVELNDNRADLDKVRELLQTRFGENGADAYLRQVYDAVNQLTALLYGGGPSARVASAEGRSAGPPGQPPSESSGLATVPPPAEAGTGESPATPPAKPVTAQSVDAPRQRGPPAGEEGIATLPPGQESVAAPQGRESTPSPPAAAGPRRLVLLDPTTGQGERIQLGRRIGGGAFNDVYEIEGQPDRVIRISKESAGSDAAKVDAFGRQALDQANRELVGAPRRFGGFDVVGVEGGGAGVLGARAEIVRRVPETARDQLSRNPDGKMTAGQAIAFDRATRELNRLGFVWLDNHRNNYWLEDLPGTDNWRVVIFDTGGIVKMRGGPEQAADAARRFQQALNAPPPEQADLFQRTRNAAGNIKDLVSAGYREELLERFGADIDVEAIFGQPSGTDNANKIGFRTDGVAAFENVQDLARVNDPAALDRAYRSLRDGGAVPAPAEAAAPTPQQAALDAARAEHAAGLKALSGEPAYRSLLDALKTPEEVAGLADVGMARQFMSPQARTEADAALAIVNATLAADPSVSGVNAVALARYINLRAGRGVAGGPREAGVAAASLAAEALLTIAPRAAVDPAELAAAADIPLADANKAIDIAQSARGFAESATQRASEDSAGKPATGAPPEAPRLAGAEPDGAAYDAMAGGIEDIGMPEAVRQMRAANRGGQGPPDEPPPPVPGPEDSGSSSSSSSSSSIRTSDIEIGSPPSESNLGVIQLTESDLAAMNRVTPRESDLDLPLPYNDRQADAPPPPPELVLPDGRRLRVGEQIGEGGFADAHLLLNEHGEPVGAVGKFLGGRRMTEADARANVIDIDRGASFLTEADILQAELIAVFPDAARPGLAQRQIGADLPPGTTEVLADQIVDVVWRRYRRQLLPAYQDAILDLWQKTIDSGLAWEDGGSRNIFFRITRDGETGALRVEAGVHDQDRVGKFDSLDPVADGHLIRLIHRITGDPARRRILSMRPLTMFDSAEMFMLKMLEAHGWIGFNPATGTFESRVLDIARVLERFPQIRDYVNVAPPPAGQVGTAAPPAGSSSSSALTFEGLPSGAVEGPHGTQIVSPPRVADPIIPPQPPSSVPPVQGMAPEPSVSSPLGLESSDATGSQGFRLTDAPPTGPPSETLSYASASTGLSGGSVDAAGLAQPAARQSQIPQFGPNDLVYGPSAKGALRALAEQAGGRLLTDFPKPASQTWIQFSVATMNAAAAQGGTIRFDLTHVQDIEGVLQRTGAFADTTTAQELRHIQANWNDRFAPVVRFYRNGVEVPPPWTAH